MKRHIITLITILHFLQLLDIRDTSKPISKKMSERSESDANNDIKVGKERTEITVELVEEKDIPEVLELLKEYFFKVS